MEVKRNNSGISVTREDAFSLDKPAELRMGGTCELRLDGLQQIRLGLSNENTSSQVTEMPEQLRLDQMTT